jgi:hypothetical protein
MDARIARQMSYATIRYLYDAIVELVTNSDDSYKRLERDGIADKGEIRIFVRRLKGSKCERLEVIDFAEGMNKEKLEKALIFAGEASGFEEGKSVRGLFGRGLKEAIIALGKGEIYSIKDDKLSIAEVWIDKKPKRRLIEKAYTPTKEEREEIGITEGNGTAVRIIVTNDKIKCPDLKTLLPQITNHYALRDINSATNRKVTLEFESPEKGSLKMFKTISYEAPRIKEKVVDQSIKLPAYGDNIELRIHESDEELESTYNNPFALAGLLIKTSGAILDNQLFKYQSEKAGCFFFGEVMWPNLAKRLREGESLLDLNRVGIEWRQEVCQVLESEIERILEPFIEEKRRQLEVKPAKPVSEKVNKLNKAICSLLNRLAKEHFSETRLDIGLGSDEKIKDLTIKPPYANLELEKERPFSVYAPLTIVGIGSGPYQAEVRSSNPTHIQVLNPTVTLQPHREHVLLYYGNFRVVGKTDKEEAVITCKFGEHEATANVRVAPPGKIGPRKKQKVKGGFFRGIEGDRGANPSQRVRYDENSGIIWIYVKFPGISRYFEDNLNFKFSETSRPMYAELIGEAFCRFISRDYIADGKVPRIPGGEVEAVTIAMNKAQAEYLHQIHDAVLKQKL